MKHVRPTYWYVDRSYMVEMPNCYQTLSMQHLRDQLETTSLKYRGEQPLGELFYRYELNGRDEAEVVHVYFDGSNGRRKRFARLRRQP